MLPPVLGNELLRALRLLEKLGQPLDQIGAGHVFENEVHQLALPRLVIPLLVFLHQLLKFVRYLLLGLFEDFVAKFVQDAQRLLAVYESLALHLESRGQAARARLVAIVLSAGLLV